MDIIDPKTGERQGEAEDVIRELQDVLTRHNYVLLHKPTATVLAKIVNLGAMQVKAITHIQYITPRATNLGAVDWTPSTLVRDITCAHCRQHAPTSCPVHGKVAG